MGLFDKLKGPVFIKESSDAEEQLEKLELLHGKAEGELKKLIEQDIKLLNYGIAGEKSLIFELKNSFMPMLILHDLFLEHEGLTAQIDFLVITKKKIFVLECKNLFGNLEVNSNGDFIRTIQMYGRNKKEGIYSPITQNQRHMDVLRKIYIESKNNFISKKLFDMAFEDRYKSVVVLANPKTVINMKYAKKAMKESIIRSDKLIDYIKVANADKKVEYMFEKRMYELAEEFLSYHKRNPVDYTKNYQDLLMQQGLIEKTEVQQYVAEKTDVQKDVVEKIEELTIPGNIEDSEIYKELKAYRLIKSREENIKAFYIFNNSQMENLIQKMPQNKEELLKVSGFNESKCVKYGEGILEIVNKYN